MNARTPLILTALFGASSAFATPTGLYCSCPPSHGNGEGSVLSAVAQLAHVDGILVRLSWSTVEPAPGVYDFSLLDEQIARAEMYGKKVSLAIVNGNAAPVWLSSLGVPIYSYSDFSGNPRSFPIPWDSTFQSRWSSFIQELGSRYHDEDTISLVYVTNSSHNGFEMQLPTSPADESNLIGLGYTDGVYAQSWINSVDWFAGAFPEHDIAHEVHPVFGSDQVALDVFAHAQNGYGGRVGVLAAWWMVHNAQEIYPGMFEILQDAAEVSHAEVQVANSYTNTPERFGEGGYEGVVDLAIDSGVRYMEVWNSDLLNSALTDLMVETSERLNAVECPADLDGSGSLDFFDISVLLNSRPDYNGDGGFDFFDISGFLQNYNAGCP